MNLFVILMPLAMLLLLRYGRQGLFRIRSMAITILVVWLANRYYSDARLQYPLDVFTVYLIVWQFVQLICAIGNRMNFIGLLLFCNKRHYVV
jgi:hypothetical protein